MALPDRPSSGPSGHKQSASSSRLGMLLAVASYASVALLFTAIYFRLTSPWSSADFARYVGSPTDWPVEETMFRFRVLMPLVGRFLADTLGLNAEWVFRGLAWVCVMLLLFFYRRYLANFAAPRFSTVFSLALVYPMIWNLCLLNGLYFPFDIPSILFFVMGCHFIYRRNWFAYYPTLVFAILNRETSVFLIAVFALTMYGTTRLRDLLWHLAAQAVLWLGLKGIIFMTISGAPAVLTKSHLGTNLGVLRDMVAMRGNFLKDWVKLLLAFGGTWLVLPWILRRQPAYLKRSLLVIIPFMALALLKGVIDETRAYSELIPVVFTPVVYSIVQGLGGATPGDRNVGNTP